jgi:folylpolyglutamate synthase/dihydropteroate synthase
MTVAGTNGKGSTVEIAGVIADHAGLSYGQYTSPHIHRIKKKKEGIKKQEIEKTQREIQHGKEIKEKIDSRKKK